MISRLPFSKKIAIDPLFQMTKATLCSKTEKVPIPSGAPEHPTLLVEKGYRLLQKNIEKSHNLVEKMKIDPVNHLSSDAIEKWSVEFHEKTVKDLSNFLQKEV